MKLLWKLVDNAQKDSLAARLRRDRFGLFARLLASVPRPLRILDVGGTQRFWEVMEFADLEDVRIVLLNLEKPIARRQNFAAVAGDATDLQQFSDDEFDVVFSNSVIEHVGDFAQQRRMAQEVKRVGERYFVQTPNYYFPVEPHFLFFGFHWLPLEVRARLHSRFDLGWRKRVPDLEKARREVARVRLLRKREMRQLFPDGRLYEERFLGLTKSFVVYGGW